MRSFLSLEQLNQLAIALVLSSLDYCNALYYGCSTHVLSQLQGIQNRACAIVCRLKKRDSKSQFLKQLHWLKVKERIEYKMLLMVFKCIIGLTPNYLSELISYNSINGSRLPSLKGSINDSVIGGRAFSVCGPRLWNELPFELRSVTNIVRFKSLLKTHLFMKSFRDV